MKNERYKWLALVAILVVLTTVVIRQYTNLGRSGIPVIIRQSDIPQDGLNLYDTDGRVPGNPQNGINLLRKLRDLRAIYLRNHAGKVAAMPDIWTDIYKHPQTYGFKSDDEVWDTFYNPDRQYADDSLERVHDRRLRQNPFEMPDKRPDGTSVTSPKTGKGRDILALSRLYVHQNVRLFKGERSTENPVGDYQVLWDDGSIEQIPYHQMVFTPTKPVQSGSLSLVKGMSYSDGFPGQAGLPEGSLTYDQWYRAIGWKNGGPRGVPGGKGVSYDGKSYR